jgi:hypothetical protein
MCPVVLDLLDEPRVLEEAGLVGGHDGRGGEDDGAIRFHMGDADSESLLPETGPNSAVLCKRRPGTGSLRRQSRKTDGRTFFYSTGSFSC